MTPFQRYASAVVAYIWANELRYLPTGQTGTRYIKVRHEKTLVATFEFKNMSMSHVRMDGTDVGGGGSKYVFYNLKDNYRIFKSEDRTDNGITFDKVFPTEIRGWDGRGNYFVINVASHRMPKMYDDDYAKGGIEFEIEG